MVVDTLKKEFVPKYLSGGEEKFYNFLLFYSVNKLMKMQKKEYSGISPNLELLEYYNQFIILYRREGNDLYLQMAKVFRKAAHKIYRLMLKRNLTPKNIKFLNLV
jgi:hypothetical protein